MCGPDARRLLAKTLVLAASAVAYSVMKGSGSDPTLQSWYPGFGANGTCVLASITEADDCIKGCEASNCTLGAITWKSAAGPCADDKTNVDACAVLYARAACDVPPAHRA